jgi:large subunit ribosomal protein L21
MASTMAETKTAKKAAKKSSEGAFAVIQTGGKQYVVRQGDILKIEKLEGDSGKKLTFDKVLFHANGTDVSVGTPHVAGMKVEAEIKGQGRAAKILVMKYKQKSRYMKRNGHRQPFTEIEIKSI